MSIFSKPQKTNVPLAPLPEGVTFHVMPGIYQGAKVTTKPSPPQQRAPVPPLQDNGIPPVPSTPPSTPSTPTPLPIVAKRKKTWIIWSAIALVVLSSGGIAIVLLNARPTPVETPPVAETPSQENSVPTPPSPEIPATDLSSPSVTSPESSPVAPTSVEVVSSLDSDQDGLTDVEEALYTTDPRRADMDADGYLDGQEIEHLYNPTGTAPIRLADSLLVKQYTNTAFGYAILYPASWTVHALDSANPREVLFTAATGEFIQVIVDENPQALTAPAWYEQQFPNVSLQSLERVFIENLEGVWTKERNTIYLTKTGASVGKRLLFGVAYNYGERTEVNFKTTLKMMLASFRVQ